MPVSGRNQRGWALDDHGIYHGPMVRERTPVVLETEYAKLRVVMEQAAALDPVNCRKVIRQALDALRGERREGPGMTADLPPISRHVVEAVQKPARIRAIAEDVNDGRPGWDTISDADVRVILDDLVGLGYIERKRGGWWHRTDKGRL